MVDPLVALVVAGVVSVAAIVLFRPKHGAFWRWRQMSQVTERVLIEDALKHLYDAEYRRISASVQSLAGALGITDNRAAELLVRIEALGLAEQADGGVGLTSDGRAYSLRIIRVHRLWERYLAEETGVGEADWHGEAEYREHVMSSEEVASLAEQMGHPGFDPHGDPIPTASGKVPPRRGQAMSSLAAGELGAIYHLEDEPDAVYSQLIAEGLHPGMQVEMIEVSQERVRFWAGGDEHVLAPVVAANVSVVPVPREQPLDLSFETLASLRPGEKAQVLRLSRACRGLERRRLMDLGILPGTAIAVEMRSASGDPTAYRVRGSVVALRKEQADQIHITKETEAA